MNKQLSHTPLPWIAEPFTNDPFAPWDVKSKKSDTEKEFICQTSGNCKANAEFIVRACNSHYEMLEALRQMKAAARRLENLAAELLDDKDCRELSKAHNQARSAIVKAEVGEG